VPLGFLSLTNFREIYPLPRICMQKSLCAGRWHVTLQCSIAAKGDD